jgi:hypothetical protein
MVYEIQRSWEQQLAAATYSISVVDWATLDILREEQDTKEDPKIWQVPEVDFLSNQCDRTAQINSILLPKPLLLAIKQ